MLPTPGGVGSETVARRLSPDRPGNAVSQRQEFHSQRPGCQKLHVSQYYHGEHCVINGILESYSGSRSMYIPNLRPSHLPSATIYCISLVFFLSSLPYFIKSPSSLFSVSSTHLFPFSPRIDGDGIIKVADFGLAVEEVNSKGYFRQDKSDCVRLPFKWMALESLQEGVFTTKTDVVRF